MSTRPAEDRCPCGRGDVYSACCRPFLDGGSAPTAESLMRSRYTAFSRGHVAHLLRTWHPSTRPAHLEIDRDASWVRLAIIDTVAGGPFDREGIVEFVAMYDETGQRHRLRERSRFVREGRDWLYLDGIHGEDL